MGLIPATTLTQCQAGNFATPTSVGAPPSDRPTASPGISVQTASPVAALPQKPSLSPEQLEAKAIKAINDFIEEKYRVDAGDDHDLLVRILKNSALCATEQYLNRQRQLIPPNPEKILDALRWFRMAQETMQGRAEASEHIVVKKFSELFAVEQGLMRRCNSQPLKPLTQDEIKKVTELNDEAFGYAEWNRKNWQVAVEANSGTRSEPYGDVEASKAGLERAEKTLGLVVRIEQHAVGYMDQLGRAATRWTKHR